MGASRAAALFWPHCSTPKHHLISIHSCGYQTGQTTRSQRDSVPAFARALHLAPRPMLGTPPRSSTSSTFNHNKIASSYFSSCSRVRVRAVAAMAPHRFCIVSDLDHTMVDHEDPHFVSLLAFNRLWNTKFRHDSYLVFSTGRSLVAYNELCKEAPLLTPDLLICSVGTEIYHMTPSGHSLDAEWYRLLDTGWNRAEIVRIAAESFPNLAPQADSEQRPHKVSFHLHSDAVPKSEYVEELRSALKGADLAVKVVHSGGVDVDVLPECASKGLALQFLQVRSQPL